MYEHIPETDVERSVLEFCNEFRGAMGLEPVNVLSQGELGNHVGNHGGEIDTYGKFLYDLGVRAFPPDGYDTEPRTEIMFTDQGEHDENETPDI